MSPSKVFAIDTSVFIADRFNWTSPKYIRLLELANLGYLKILIPSIVKMEVLKKIDEHSHSAEKAWKEFKNEGYGVILTTEKVAEVFKDDFDKDFFITKLTRLFDQFLNSKGVEVVENDCISIDEILSSYFDQKPPFTGSGKKHEFPDAIALLSLKEWIKINKNEHIVLISHDQDWINFAEVEHGFSVLGSIQKAIEKVLTVDIEASILLENNKKQFSDAILNTFKSDYGTYLDIDGGDVVNTRDEEVIMLELSIASSVGDDDSIANVFATATIVFNAEVKYPDFGTASYDSEDKEYIFHHQIEAIREVSIDVDAEFDVRFDFENNCVEILSVLINTDISSIEVEADPFDY
jgi:hypothetical protein